MHKKIFKYMIYLFFGLGVTAVSLILFINSEWGSRSIAGITNKYSPVRVELGKFRLDIFRGKVVLDDLTVYDKESIKMAGIGQLIIDIRLRPVFSKKYEIDSLIISDLNADFNSDQIKSFMVKDRKKNSEPLNLIIKKIKIVNTDIRYKDIAVSAEYGFKNTKITAAVNVKDSDYSLRLDNSEIKINSSGINKTINNDSLIVNYKDSGFDIEPAKFRTEGLYLSVGGKLKELFSNPVADIRLSAELDNRKFFDKPEVFARDSGVFKIEACITGEIENPELDISVTHPDGVIYGQKVTSIDLKVNLKDKLFSFDSEIQKSKNEKVDFGGTVDLASVYEKGLISSVPDFDKIVYDLMVKTDNFSLQNIPDMPDIKLDLDIDIKGRGIKPENITAGIVINTKLPPFTFREFRLLKSAGLKADLSWKMGKLVSQINLTANSLEWRNYKLSGIDLLCSMNESGLIEVDKCEIRLDDAAVSLKGNSTLFDKDWHVLKDPEINISLTGKNILTEEFYPAIDTELNFGVNAKGRMRSLKGEYYLNTAEINYLGINIDNISADGKFSGREIILDRLNIATGGGNIAAHAKITDFNKLESGIKAEKLKIEFLYPEIREIFKGEVSFDITAGGDVKNPTVKGYIELKDSFIREKRMPDLKADLSLFDMNAELNLDLGFDLNAKLDLKDENYSFNAEFKKWDYTFLIPDSTKRNRNGFIDGSVRGSGNLKQLQDYNIKADLDSVAFNVDGRSIIAGNKLSAEFTKGILKLEKFRLNLLNEGFIEAEGAVSPESDLNFNIIVNLPIRTLGFIHSDMNESKGDLKAGFEIRGKLAVPEVKGKVNLEKIELILPVTEQRIYDLNGEITLEPDKITVRSISGRIEKGRFNLNGDVNLLNNRIQSSNINFNSVALPVDYQDYFEGILTSDLNFTGTPSKGRLKGELIFVEGLYYHEFDPFGKVFEDKGRKIIKTSANIGDFPEIELNLTLKSRHSIVIDNSSAFIELNPDIEIKGSLSAPLITGRARMEKGGFIVFQKNTFSINRGVLDFAPVHGMLPTVDVQSETTVSDFTVYLAISGNLQNPRFSLSSVPYKSHADILTILLLGKNVNEFLKGNETAVSGTKEKFLANWIYNTFQQDIADKFGLDYLEFTVSDGFSTDDISGTGLTIGKNISDRLILKYSASNDASRFVQKGIADYQFFENIIFSGFQTTDGKFGAEINYKLEYR
jgi:hypothetical protein